MLALKIIKFYLCFRNMDDVYEAIVPYIWVEVVRNILCNLLIKNKNTKKCDILCKPYME